MTKVRWIIFAVICAAILGVLIYSAKKDDVAFNGDPYRVETAGEFKDNIFGSKDLKVVLFEYGDFQCPACGNIFSVVKQLKQKYKDDLTFVFRNFPLTSIHPNALAAATVAESAALQGKFFEMHDLLYQNQSSWQSTTLDARNKLFEGYAKELGLDIQKYKSDLANSAVSKKISHDRSVAKKISVSSTPTFFLNGTKLDDKVWSNPTEFEKKIQEAITKATGEKFETEQSSTTE